MILAFVGRQGEGKTLMMSIWGLLTSRAYKVPLYANYDLITSEPIIDLKHFYSLHDCIICFDEIHFNSDSRLFKNNVEFTAWIDQTRKKNIIFMYNTQSFGKVDIRIRDATHYIMRCKKLGEGNHKLWIKANDDDTYDLGIYKYYQGLQRFYSIYNTREQKSALL